MNLSTIASFANIALTAALAAYGAAIIALTAALFFGAKANGAGADDSNHGGDGSRDDDNGGKLPGVSVVIPFRNEERNLGALLASLDKQVYGGMIEVILVNDQSEDNGVNIINTFYPSNDRISIKIIDLQPSADTRLTSKQQALDLGVAASSHPLIALTDADMILAPNWIKSLADSQMSTNAALVFGHTSIINTAQNTGVDKDTGTDNNTNISGDTGMNAATAGKKSLFALLESYQLEFLFAFAYAFSKLGLTGSCMGNNVLVTKEGYLKCGGQRGIGYSIVEDRALLELMRRRRLKTAASEPFFVTAETYPSRAKTQFANQTLRWAAGGLRPGGGLFAAGLLLLAQNTLFPLSIAGIMPAAAAAACAANFLLTWAFLAIAFRKNNSPASKLLFPLYYLFMLAETVIFAVAMVFRPKIKWKDRKL